MSDNGTGEQIGGIDPTTGYDPVAGEAPDSPGSMVNPFLKNVNPADRPVLERYLKDWDANVTRRFQSIHDQYRPYKSLGDVETIQSAMAVYNMLDSDPMKIYNLLQESLADEIAASGQQPQFQPGVQPEVSGPHEIWGEMPPAAIEKLGQMEQLLTAMAQRLVDGDKRQKQADDDAHLETTLNGLREKFGDFDEEYVLSKMFRGMKPEEAVQAYKQFVSGIVSQNGSRPAPRVLTGAGSIPTGQQPANNDQRKAAFADLLANSKGEGR